MLKMEVKEAQELKKEAELVITAALNVFTKQTGICIDSIDIQTHRTIGTATRYSTKLDIRL